MELTETTTQIYTYLYLPGQTAATPVGLLECTEDGRESFSTFRYGRQYLQNPSRLAVDPVTLPLHDFSQNATYRTEEGFSLFGGIRDASPDGWGRHVLEKQYGRLQMSEAEYLLLAGNERVGALAFGTDLSGPLQKEDESKISLEELMQAADKVDNEQSLEKKYQRFFVRGSSLGGARPKAVTIWKDQWWLAKFSRNDDRYDIARAEHAIMSLALYCGLNVPPTELVQVLGKSVYLIQRFDRAGSVLKNLSTRKHFNSGLSLLGAHESESSRYSYEDLAAVIRQFSSQPEKDCHELFSRMIFNILVNNTDDHLRNHGFLLDLDKWNLSPLYDVVPQIHSAHERFLALGIGTEGRRATLNNALSKCQAFYLSYVEAVALIQRLQKKIKQWPEFFKKSGFTKAEAEKFSSCFLALDEKV